MRFLIAMSTGLLQVLAATALHAQSAWPAKDVRIIVPFAAASTADQMARLLAEKLKPVWGQTVVIENIAGASGSIGVSKLTRSAPDGYTFAISGDAALVVNPSLYRNISYDTLKDVTPILQIGYTPNILVVNNDVAARTLQDLVAWARDKPGQVKFNSAGYGTSQHMGIEQLKKAAGIDILHVPTKEATAPEVMGGHVHASFMNITMALPLVRAEKLRAVAQSGARRSNVAGDIPTVSELGYPGFNAVAWFGFIAPAATPDAIVRKVHADVAKALAEPDLKAKLTDRGVELVVNSPDEFAALIRSEIPRIAELIKASGIKLD